MAEAGQTQKQNIAGPALWALAGVLFCVLWTMCSKYMSAEKSMAPEIILLGDSIYGEYRGPGSVGEQIGASLGKSVFNGAVGGTCMAKLDEEVPGRHREDFLSMAALAKSVVAEDFGVQQRVHSAVSATEYLDSVVDQLEQIDFDKAEYLLIGFGMNDYQNGIRLDNPANPMDEYTYGGALRGAVEQLAGRYPNLKIVLLSPTFSWYPQYEEDCSQRNWGGGLLEEYVALEETIAREYGVGFVDLYHELYAHDTYEEWEKYTKDGVHPTEGSRELLAKAIAEYLEEKK